MTERHAGHGAGETVARVKRVKVGRRNDSAIADTSTPPLSWTVDAPARDWMQQCVEIRLDQTSVALLEGPDSVLVAWPFAPLGPRARHTIEVRVTGIDGVTSAWSEQADVIAGFLADGEWQARFVGIAPPAAVASRGLLRAVFVVGADLTRATLYATARGVYQVAINGTDVDDSVLKPGWTSYQYRLVHETTDVTALVHEGRNAIGVRLAGGWWTEKYGFDDDAVRVYGEQPSVALQLHLTFADGSQRVVATDSSWRGAHAGEVVSSGIYLGEVVDARNAAPGWSSPGFVDTTWTPVVVEAADQVPTAQIAEPVRRVATFPVRDVLTSPSGGMVLDFGQNLVGRLRIQVTGPRGTVVTARHAEVLDAGEVAMKPLRAAASVDTFILSGGDDVFEPEFTFHGFRYVEISGWPGAFDPEDVVAIALGSDMRRTGWFDTSHDLLNSFHENVVWGMRGNFLSLPTDCPQRDERMGWTGDIQAFAPAGSFLFDCDAFLTSWLRDVSLEQEAHGGICPVVVPLVLHWGAIPVAAWGDATVIVPDVIHERFGDQATLRNHYPSMRSWAEELLRIAGPRMLWEGSFQFGDWLDPDAPAESPGRAKADPDLVASAYLFRSLTVVADAAGTLGHGADDARYRRAADQVRQAWLSEYADSDGRLTSDAQTAYALAIAFGLAPQESRTAYGERLAELVRAGGFRIGTGFVGTPIIQDALIATGHADVAARLMLQTQMPSWLYPVTMGATTVWERWDSMLPDGSINSGDMTSFNHYALGAVADWLHRTVAGLGSDAPGYRRLRVAPVPLAGLEWAQARHETPYGEAAVRWEAIDRRIVVTVRIPANSTAIINLPGCDAFEVGSGDHAWAIDDPRAVTADAGTGAREVAVDDSALRRVTGLGDHPGPFPGRGERTNVLAAERRKNTWTSRTPATDHTVPAASSPSLRQR